MTIRAFAATPSLFGKRASWDNGIARVILFVAYGVSGVQILRCVSFCAYAGVFFVFLPAVVLAVGC
eukprot:68282-Lingulodinium_polyedra.AAC.1